MKESKTVKKSEKAKKAVLIISALVLIICTVNGSLSWMKDKTDSVVNTFTYGKINITLNETQKGPFKIVPGVNIAKDPLITVEAGSEDCYLFVKIDEGNWPVFKEQSGARKVEYKVADGWQQISGVNNIYYRIVKFDDTVRKFSVIKDDTVTVSDSLTKDEIKSAGENPVLTFTAYAVQMIKSADGIFTPSEAWEQAKS